MKLPNGYGSVSHNPGNRRRPYMVRKTIGWHYEKGKKIRDYIIIGYAKTREEGFQMLAEYNSVPLSGSCLDMTLDDVYKAWSKRRYESISKSSANSYSAAYIVCKPLYNKKIRNITLNDLQNIIDTCNKNYPTLKKIKVLLKQLYDYALKHDIVTKDYASMIDLKPYRNQNPDKRPNIRLTYDEVCAIWKNKDDPYIQIVLMMIYSGVRVSELLNLKKENISLDTHSFKIVQSKTDNGIRTVPIADCVYDFWVDWYARSSDCQHIVCTINQKHLSYSNFYKKYYKTRMLKIGISKTPHCCRHTCLSLLAENGVDQVLVKKIVGHSSESVTEKVYTHPDITALRTAINKIPFPKW